MEVYIEGGGRKNKSLDIGLRRAFKGIFEKILGEEVGKKIKPIASGGRGDAMNDYRKHCEKTSGIAFLLVDSENSEKSAELEPFEQRKEFLKEIFPNEISDLREEKLKRIFFMVVNTESWLLTDKPRLQDFFGQGFKVDKLPQNLNYEKISKKDIEEGFKTATKDCKKKLTKAQVFDLLEKINTESLLKHGEEIKRFFEAIKKHAK
ncbi:DUF4276 family protein [Helicobacter ailurogastricus]|uniref:DUF4276 family protein n=1 Tax=Helicobacter ailurogastricus TaxID=1578720 RepID=UPI00244D94B1|nr:DUF4276 family protein [Helicobacter ailurogastricus]GMB89973.1 DUF4276 family protein [Helicobacter ailurogastricus]